MKLIFIVAACVLAVQASQVEDVKVHELSSMSPASAMPEATMVNCSPKGLLKYRDSMEQAMVPLKDVDTAREKFQDACARAGMVSVSAINSMSREDAEEFSRAAGIATPPAVSYDACFGDAHLHYIKALKESNLVENVAKAIWSKFNADCDRPFEDKRFAKAHTMPHWPDVSKELGDSVDFSEMPEPAVDYNNCQKESQFKYKTALRELGVPEQQGMALLHTFKLKCDALEQKDLNWHIKDDSGAAKRESARESDDNNMEKEERRELREEIHKGDRVMANAPSEELEEEVLLSEEGSDDATLGPDDDEEEMVDDPHMDTEEQANDDAFTAEDEKDMQRDFNTEFAKEGLADPDYMKNEMALGDSADDDDAVAPLDHQDANDFSGDVSEIH